MMAVLFMSHQLTKIEVPQPIIFNFYLLFLFIFLTLASFKKPFKKDKLFSVEQTNQMKGLSILSVGVT